MSGISLEEMILFSCFINDILIDGKIDLSNITLISSMPVQINGARRTDRALVGRSTILTVYTV